MTPVADLAVETGPVRRKRGPAFTSADDAALREAIEHAEHQAYRHRDRRIDSYRPVMNRFIDTGYDLI